MTGPLTPRPVLCQHGQDPQPAVIGPHAHWDGAHYLTCPAAESCTTPSCHGADAESDYWAVETRLRDLAEAVYAGPLGGPDDGARP